MPFTCPTEQLCEGVGQLLIMCIWITVILLCTASYPSNAAKILGVLMTESKSRYSNLRTVADELASRGHEVCELTY